MIYVLFPDSETYIIKVRTTKYFKNLDKMYRTKYNISLEDYKSMSIAQNNRCIICGRTSKKRLVVDHDHKTGAVRGLLCNYCNTGLGSFMDNISFLESAIQYLKNRK